MTAPMERALSAVPRVDRFFRRRYAERVVRADPALIEETLRALPLGRGVLTTIRALYVDDGYLVAVHRVAIIETGCFAFLDGPRDGRLVWRAAGSRGEIRWGAAGARSAVIRVWVDWQPMSLPGRIVALVGRDRRVLEGELSRLSRAIEGAARANWLRRL